MDLLAALVLGLAFEGGTEIAVGGGERGPRQPGMADAAVVTLTAARD